MAWVETIPTRMHLAVSAHHPRAQRADNPTQGALVPARWQPGI